MGLLDTLGTAVNDFMDDMGYSVSYKSVLNDSDVQISATVEIQDYSTNNVMSRADRGYIQAIFGIRESDIPDPQSGDTIILDGRTYHFQNIVERNAGMYRLLFAFGKSAVKYSEMGQRRL